MVRQILILFIFLASSYFFTLKVVPRPVMLLLTALSIGIILLVVVIGLVYDRKRRFNHNFSLEVSLMLLSGFLCIFGAKWGHGQSYVLSLWAQKFIYFYFFYFFLHIVRIRNEELIKLMVIMGIAFLLLWFLQYIIFPKVIFNSRIDVERGTIRIFIPGGSFAGLIYFYFLHLFLKTNKPKYIIFCILVLIMPVLQGTRSSIVYQLMGTLVFILFSTQVKSKLRNIILMFAGVVLFFFIFQDIIIQLIAVSQEQSTQEGDTVRKLSTNFFLTDFYTNKINYIIGNGVGHMASAYGMKIAYYKLTYGFYQSDIGIIGNYTQFGVLYVIGMFLIIRKIFIVKIQKKYNYIKYWAMLLVIGAIFGNPFSRPDGITLITSVLYIMDVSSYELKLESQKNINN